MKFQSMGSELNATPLYTDAMRLLQQGQLAAAESRLQECLLQMPGSTMLLGNLAALFIMQGRYHDARAALEQVLAVDRNIAEAWLNLAIIDDEQSADLDAALRNCDEALRLRDNYPEAHYNRGNLLARMNRLDDAIASYRQAVRLAPGYLNALHNLANTLRSARRPELALESFSAAIKLTPRADLYANRGYALRDVGEYQAAVKSFDKALQLDPSAVSCRGIRLHTKAQICDWSNWQGQIEEMTRSIERGDVASPPFCVLHLLDSGPLQKVSAERWTMLNHPAHAALGETASRIGASRLRIGYFSADFNDHPVAQFLVNLLQHQDDSRFESIGFSFGNQPDDAMRQRIVESFDQFHDVTRASDRDIAALAREVGVDIAVDLGGHTANGRPGIFAFRAAPIQINYLGYPGTMGAPYIDYLMADAVVIPKENAGWYSEKIVTLPNLYTNAYAHDEHPASALRRDYRLPESGVVFCCLNNSWKFDPDMFACWINILKKTGDSVLFLSGSEPLAVTHLRREAKRSGIDPARLVFTGRIDRSEYLARFKLADLFLDTFPYSAATTALDALYMGLPLVTLRGATYPARQAASILASMGLDELVTTTRDQYQALAIDLAREPQRLLALKVRVEAAAAQSPAFNARDYARHVEAAYTAMQARHVAGLAPEHIVVVR